MLEFLKLEFSQLSICDDGADASGNIKWDVPLGMTWVVGFEVQVVH